MKAKSAPWLRRRVCVGIRVQMFLRIGIHRRCWVSVYKICLDGIVRRRTKSFRRIYDEPTRRSYQTNRCSCEKGRSPVEVGSEPRSQDGRDCRTDLIAGVHESRNRTGRRARNVGRNRPEGTLRQIQRSRPACENKTRDTGAVHLRSEGNEKACERDAEGCKTAASQARPTPSGEAVVDSSTE